MPPAGLLVLLCQLSRRLMRRSIRQQVTIVAISRVVECRNGPFHSSSLMGEAGDGRFEDRVHRKPVHRVLCLLSSSLFHEQLSVRVGNTLPLGGAETLLEVDVRTVPDLVHLHGRIMDIET